MNQTKVHYNPCPRQNCSTISKICFGWINPLFWKGYKNDLEAPDLYNVLPEDASQKLGDDLEREWQKELDKSRDPTKKYKPSLTKALTRLVWGQFVLLGMVALFEECVTRVLQPICLGRLITYFTENDTEHGIEYAYYYGTGVVTLGTFYIITHHPFFFGVQHVGMKLRIACCSLVYRKSLKLSKGALGRTSIGQMVNLLSNDVNRFDQAVIFLQYLVVGPVQTAIVTAVLWQTIGVSCIVGVLVLLLFVPFQSYMGKWFSKLRMKTATRTDERIRLMNETILGMRVIKMYTWEKSFANLISMARKKEIGVIRLTSHLRAINMSMFYASSKLIMYLILLCYMLLGNIVKANVVFVTTALFNNVRLIMTLFFPSAIQQAAETKVSIRRLEKFLLMEERKELEPAMPTGSKFSANNKTLADNRGVYMKNFTAKWNPEVEDDTLTNITFTVRPGQLLAIIGPVGSGKGSLLHAILGELPATSGSVHTVGKIAYTSQEPWVFASSVRQNVTFGQEFNEYKYNNVVRACALDKDFIQLPYGDRTLVGDRGMSLSGGQKARVNLARAVYLDADVYLLDDPLSAVDTHVGRHLFDECIMKYLRSKTRILVTHQLQYLKKADQIIILRNGVAEIQGTFNDLVNSGVDFAKLLTQEEDRRVRLDTDKSGPSSPSTEMPMEPETPTQIMSEGSIFGASIVKDQSSSYQDYHETDHVDPGDNPEKLEDPKQVEETRSRGGMGIKMYGKYLRAGTSWFLLFFMFLANIITQTLFSGGDFFLGLWTDKEDRYYRSLHLTTTETSLSKSTMPISNVSHRSTSFDLTTSSFSLITRAVNMANTSESALAVSPNELSSLASTALSTVTMSTPSSAAPEIFNYDRYMFLYIYTGLVVGLIIASFIRTIWFYMACMNSSENLHNSMFRGIIKAPIVFFDNNPAGRILNRFGKDIGQIDDLLPPTLFDVIGISLNIIGIVVNIFAVNYYLTAPTAIFGLICYFLRIYYLRTGRDVKRLEGITRSPVFSHLSTTLQGLTTVRAFNAQEIFKKDFDTHQDLHSSAWYLFLASTRWFGVILDWLCCLYLGLVTYSFVAMKDTMHIQGGDVGMAISQAMMLTGTLQWGVRQSAELENQMVSVERVLEYTKVETEAKLVSDPDKKPPTGWPSHGQIQFDNMSLSYGGEAPVLQNLNCIINQKEKVGIVGRTGAGKSSLLAALFRMTEPEGTIYIDGIPTKDVGLHELRSKISIIPQDPVLFTGTLRTNLDPFSEYTDEALWHVLEEVELKEPVQDLPGGLDSVMSEGGNNFSVGQRQLVCLARAILRKNRILVLDEATANVDPRTDALIQNTIRNKFQQCTVLTIAHRLNTIMDSDRVMVMDAGRIKEIAEPHILLKNCNSQFYNMVQQTGKGTARYLTKIAEEAYFAKKENPEPATNGSIVSNGRGSQLHVAYTNPSYTSDETTDDDTTMQTTNL